MSAPGPIPMRSYLVSYAIHEIVDTANDARSAVSPIKGGVLIREAISRTDAIAQALRDLCDAGLTVGRYEEIRISVKEGT